MSTAAAIVQKAVPRNLQPRGSGGARRRWAAWLMISPVLTALVIFALYPAVYLIALSFTKSTLGQPFKTWIGFANYRWLTIGGDDILIPSLARATAFALGVSVVELVLGVALAVQLLALRRAGHLVRSITLLPLMTPPVLVGIAWKLLLAPGGGLINGKLITWGIVDAPISFLGGEPWAMLSIMIADIWQWTPFVAILAFAALRQVPDDVREAARLDGASERAILWEIVLPLTAPLLLAILLIRLIMAFKTFDVLYILTFGGPGNATNMAGFTIWRTALRSFDVGTAAAQTVLFSIVVSVVTLPVVWLHAVAERRAT